MDAIAALTVKVEGRRELGKIRTGLANAEKQFLERSAKHLARDVRRRVPGGPRGRIGNSVYSIVRNKTTIEVGVIHPGARALNYGAYITPKGLSKLPMRELRKQKRRLKFKVGGKTVFAPFVRLKGTHYFERGLLKAPSTIDEEWRKAFDNVTGPRYGPAVGRILPR